MPAIYRMPLFYVALLVAGSAVAVGTLVGRGGRSPTSPEPIAPAPEPVRVAPSRPPDEGDPADGILRTAEGLRRKVVVKDLDLVCRDQPTDGVPIGEPLDYFSIWYLHGEEHPAAGPAMVQIGPAEGPPRGWIPAGSVLEWDTRLVARPTPPTDRPPLVMYRDEVCLKADLTGTPCPNHAPAPCPIEGREPGGTVDGRQAPMGLPILRSEQVPTGTIFEVASLVRDEAPRARIVTIPPDLRAALRQVNIAFVIDTTASMQSSIDAVRRVASGLAADAARQQQDIRLNLALVEYRDDSPEFGYVARVVSPFTNPSGFRLSLDEIAAARNGDGSIDEAVLAGVAAALPGPVTDPVPHLDWPRGRAGELATKMIVLIGDAPDHASDLTRARELADLAREQEITIAAVSIDQQHLSDDEQARYRDQWRTLAEGSYRPPDPEAGFHQPIPPLLPSLAEAGQLVPRLQALIANRIEHARKLAELAQAAAEGKLQQYVDSRGLKLDDVWPVLVDRHLGEPDPSARPDPRINGRVAPSVRRGWIAERADGQLLVTLAVLMSRAEIGTLIDELTQVQQATQGTAQDLEDLLQIGTAVAAGETSFLSADRGDQTVADYLRRRQGLPPARPDSLLRRSQSDLLRADSLTRAALDERLSQAIADLIRLRDSVSWSDPRQTVRGLAPIPYNLVDF